MFKRLFKDREDECPVPLPPKYVTLARPNERAGFVKLKLRPEPINEKKSAERFAKWIRCANYTIDIAFYFIFHKKIIEELIKKCKKGVRVRIIILRQEELRLKHYDYIDLLKRKGCMVLYLDVWSILVEEPLLMIDNSDPDDRPALVRSTRCVLIGNTPLPQDLVPSGHLLRDIKDIRNRTHPLDTIVWENKFYNIWNAFECNAYEVSPSFF